MKWAFWIAYWEVVVVGMGMVVGMVIADIMEAAITVVAVTEFPPVEAIAPPHLLR